MAGAWRAGRCWLAAYLARWSERIAVVPPGLATLPPSVKADVLEAVQGALLHGDAIDVTYQRRSAPKPKAQTLYPLGLVVSEPFTYLVAASEFGDEPWLFALHRMKSAVLSRKPARTRDAAFSLDGFIEKGGMQFGYGRTARFVAVVSDSLRDHLQESPLSNDQTILPQRGKNKLTATLPISWRLKWWVLSKTGDIEVLQPAALRGEVGLLLREGAKVYMGAKKSTPRARKSIDGA
jgi:predicted DNA-binding transcriptional regulator YafY